MRRTGTASVSRPARGGARKRILVVNVFFDEFRRPRGSPFKIPQAMGPAYLAGAFSRGRCEVRLYNEQSSGPLRDRRLLAWPDMLVLTGLTSGFDRMLHLTAYVRTLNERVVVVAGGPAIRALPRHAERFFDHACHGDIEELRTVVRETFGEEYANEEMFPRFDLMNSLGRIAYVESSRYCNFRCGFCSLTGEGRRYRNYELDYVRRQILALGRRRSINFIDNNFYGNDRSFFLERIELLKELRREGRLKGWSALVTGDFFLDPENVELAREAGCHGLFSGVESFDTKTLMVLDKRQNTRLPQVEMIRGCLEAGIVFLYGLMLDVTSRSLADLRREIEFVLDTPEISLPSFLTLTIPLPGTRYFRECLDRGQLLPNLRLSDLDGITVTMKPVDPIDEVVAFVRDLCTLRGYRKRVARHCARFYGRYRRRLGPVPMLTAMGSAGLISAPMWMTSPGLGAMRSPRRTHLSTTEPLDPSYRPMMRVASRYESYFRPTRITDAAGRPAAELVEDLTAPPAEGPIGRASASGRLL